jgi:hypothetical protein
VTTRLSTDFPQASLKFSTGVSIRFGVLCDLCKGVQPMALTSGFALHCTLGFLVGWGTGRPAQEKGGKAPRCEIHSTILKRPSLDEDIDISLGDQAAKPDGIGGFSLEFMAVI